MNEIIDQLLSRWEECYERGQPLSAEQLCEKHPELLAQVKSQIEAIQAIDAKFGSLMETRGQHAESSATDSHLNQRLQVTSEFQVEVLHASGGLGDVYLASEPNLKRQVAIKFPRKSRLNAEQVARFEREAQITGRLNHPGIVPVISLKQDHEQQPCYVMRFVDGLTLRQRVEQLGQELPSQGNFFSSMEFRKLLQNFATICNIVAYAHDQGIIHRDIKPENIIIGPFGETLLMDWGLAKVMQEPADNLPPIPVSSSADTVSNKTLKTVDGQVMGTPAYASPEQLQGRVDLTDFRSDIFSLGATLHFLLTGSIQRDSDLAQLRHLSGARVPARLVAICRQALAECIDQRYQSATKLREDIECYLADEPISVVPESVWSRFVRSIRRRPGPTAAVIVGVLMTIIAGTFGSWLLNQKNRELSTTNSKLESSIAKTLIAQQRSKSTNEILSQALFAATPEVSLGKERTIRQFLEEVSQELRGNDALNLLVAADTHRILAEAYLSLGVFESAQQHADLSHQIYLQELGEESAETLLAQSRKALILSRRDQDEQAIQLAAAALERGRQLKSLESGALMVLIDIYAHACSRSPAPDHAKIVGLHREACEIAAKAYGANDRQTLKMVSNLATALMDSGDLQNAEKTLNQSHAAHVALVGPTHPETLVDTFNLIALKFNQGEIQAANQQGLANLSTFEEVLGPLHQRSIRLRLLLTQTWLHLQQWDSAAQEATIVLERSEANLGPVHQQTFEARGLLTTALIASGKLDEAQSFAAEQFRIAEKNFGPKHPHTVQAATLLFDLAEKQGDPAAMAIWLEHLRGSEWEAAAEEMLKAARELKQSKQKASSNSN
jgi:serine/threonine protein kinase